MRALLLSAVALCLATQAQDPDATLAAVLRRLDIPAANVERLYRSIAGAYVTAGTERFAAVAFRETNNDRTLAGPLSVVLYDKKSLTTTSAPIEKEDDACNGAPESIEFVDDYLLVSTHLNPSAGCLHVVDSRLHPGRTLAGFRPLRIAPHTIVFIEDMIHFASVHPERLQLADLATGKTQELYPSQNDNFRKRLIAEHAQHMPPQDTCRELNDPCDPALFDEDITHLASDESGRFAFTLSQSASHATKSEEPPTTVASQMMLYLYERKPTGWLYCAVPAKPSEIAYDAKWTYESVAKRCIPDTPVIPDMTTAQFNPFMRER